MRIKKIMPYLMAILVLIAAVTATEKGRNDIKSDPDTATADEMTPPEEVRGIWVTYMTLDVENEADKESAFRKKIDKMIEDMKSRGFNTMFAQVRPFCDAIYRSAYYPWSHIISGNQGEDPGFDPLSVICERCRENGIGVHAWINPYRVSTGQTPSALSQDNPYAKDPSLGVEINGGIYLDPANEEARELIVNGVIELLTRYDIDGIQFDDYFYPEGCGDFDARDYEEYKASTASPLSLEGFRKENVNALIRAVHKAVRDTKKGAVFGISPQGNLANNDGLYADVRLWCAENGYIDYICPQIYFSLDNPALTFEDALDDWLKMKKRDGLRMYIGLAGYKAGTDADSGTWLDSDDVLKTEIEIIREKDLDGFLLYSYDSLNDKTNSKGIESALRYISAVESTIPTQ